MLLLKQFFHCQIFILFLLCSIARYESEKNKKISFKIKIYNRLPITQKCKRKSRFINKLCITWAAPFYVSKHTLSTENKQNKISLTLPSPYVIYEWSLGCRDSIFSSSIPSDISSSWPPSNVNQRSDAWST